MSIFGSSSSFADRSEGDKIYGVVIGIVTANADPTHAYRVKVRLPHLPGGGDDEEEQDSTHWARISTFLAGEYIGDDKSLGPRGAYFMPEIGDEVLVMFAFGDVSMPVVIGRLWSDVAPEAQGGGSDEGKPNHPVYAHTQKKGKLTTAVDGDPDGTPKEHLKSKTEEKKNDLSGIRTRSGHMLVFNDNKDEPAMYLRTSKKHRIELVDGKSANEFKGILIADADDNYVWLKSGSAQGDIDIKTKGNVNITADKDIKLESKQNIIMKATQNLETESKEVSMKASAGYKVDCQTGTITASGNLSLKGNPININ